MSPRGISVSRVTHSFRIRRNFLIFISSQCGEAFYIYCVMSFQAASKIFRFVSKIFSPFIHEKDCTVCNGRLVEREDDDHFYHSESKQFSSEESKRIQEESEKRYRQREENGSEGSEAGEKEVEAGGKKKKRTLFFVFPNFCHGARECDFLKTIIFLQGNLIPPIPLPPSASGTTMNRR